MIIAFAHTTPMLLRGEKSVTRRDWKPTYLASWQAAYDAGKRTHQAYDQSPRSGGKKIGDLILTERPCLERLDAMPFDDIAAEGYAGEYESVEDFIAATFPNAKPSDEWAVVRFEFQP